ncbi:MAG: twin-arginine translocase TatA/TatE family subunit, partial [Bryobacteraceae bacterium]
HMGPLGVQEIILIFILALILFGPKKLPELGRMLGRAVSEFRKAKNELRSTWESHMSEIERESHPTPPYTAPADDHSPAEYSYPYEDYDPYDSEPTPEAHPQAAHMHEAEPPAQAVKAEAVVGHEVSVPHSVPASGTAPRSNGTSHGDAAPISAQEEHPAA